MAKAKAVTSKLALEERLPDLRIAESRTESSAIHPMDYIGPLAPWPNFVADVRTSFRNHDWTIHHRNLYLRPIGQPGPHSLLREHVRVANETGVQGRWQERIGQVMSGVFEEQGYPLTFADFDAGGVEYSQ